MVEPCAVPFRIAATLSDLFKASGTPWTLLRMNTIESNRVREEGLAVDHLYSDRTSHSLSQSFEENIIRFFSSCTKAQCSIVEQSIVHM